MSDGFRISSSAQGTEIVGSLNGLTQLSSILDQAIIHGKSVQYDADSNEPVLAIIRTDDWAA